MGSVESIPQQKKKWFSKTYLIKPSGSIQLNNDDSYLVF